MLLVVLQLATGPLAHALPGTMPDCDGFAATALDATAGDDCGACPPGAQGCEEADGSHHRDATGHATCVCPCGHTPSLALPVPIVAGPAGSDLAALPTVGPAFPPPLFDLLRPPN